MKIFYLLLGALFLFSAPAFAQTEKPSGIVLDSLASDGVRIVEYIPTDVCANRIHIEVNRAGILENVVFTRSCDGNAKGIGALLKGMKVQEAIEKLKGIPCGKRKTSCPDQLAQALLKMQEKNSNIF